MIANIEDRGACVAFKFPDSIIKNSITPFSSYRPREKKTEYFNRSYDLLRKYQLFLL